MTHKKLKNMTHNVLEGRVLFICNPMRSYNNIFATDCTGAQSTEGATECKQTTHDILTVS